MAEETNEVLLEAQLVFVDGAVDYKGQPAVRSKSGYWRSAWFIIGTHFHISNNIDLHCMLNGDENLNEL